MISRYEQNKQKYQSLVEYTISQSNIEEDIKKEILKVMEKYRLAIGWMEVEEVEGLIEKCVTEGSSNPLKKELHCLVTGNVYGLDDSYSDIKRKRSKEDREDDCYNLD